MFSRGAEIRKAREHISEARDCIRTILLRDERGPDLLAVVAKRLDAVQQELSDLAAKQEMFEMLNCKV